MKDVNNTRMFVLIGGEDFTHDSDAFVWDGRRRGFRLARKDEPRPPDGDPAHALAAWSASLPMVRDEYGLVATISDDGKGLSLITRFTEPLETLPVLDRNREPITAPAGVFTDLAAGGDGRLALAFSDAGEAHGVLVFHLRQRHHYSLALDLAPGRVVIDPFNRIHVVARGRLLLLEGESPRWLPEFPPDEFTPAAAVLHPLREVHRDVLPEGWTVQAMTADADHLSLLVYNDAFDQRILQKPLPDATTAPRLSWTTFPLDRSLPFATDMASYAPGEMALITARDAADPEFLKHDALVVGLHPDAEPPGARVATERYPMLSLAAPRWVKSTDGNVYYPAKDGVRRLYPLAIPRFAGKEVVKLERRLDAGDPETVWGRLYLDGVIPPGCAVSIAASVSNGSGDEGEFIEQPPLVYAPRPSEMPFARSMADVDPPRGGLFELLLQRDAGNVRRLVGQYLRLRITMKSDGRRSPIIHCIRVYAPRFDPQEQYLPQHFHQQESYDPNRAAANDADLRERYFANLEGMLTPLEGWIADTHLLLDPNSVPRERLAHLAEFLGLTPPGDWPEARTRRWLSQIGLLQQWRGTLRGVLLALDIACDGAVARGEIVVVENYRLRRTMATILGVDLEDEDHPLTLGSMMSGNSIVGDSLILSEASAREFLALLDPSLGDAGDKAAVEAFFEKYAHQVSVLLHGPAKSREAMVSDVLEREAPAHLQWRIISTDHPFVLGLSPLLSVHTFIETRPPPRGVILDASRLDYTGFIRNPASLAPEYIADLTDANP